MTALSEIRGVTAIRGGGGICISKQIFFGAGQDGTPALAVFYVHFKLSALAVSHSWAKQCEGSLLCCKRDEMSPVERCLRNLSFVCL